MVHLKEITFTIGGENLRQFQKLKTNAQYTDDAEFLNACIGFMQWGIECKSKGDQIISENAQRIRTHVNIPKPRCNPL